MCLQFDNKINQLPKTSSLTLTGESFGYASLRQLCLGRMQAPVVLCWQTLSAVAHGGNHATLLNAGNPRTEVAPQDRAASPSHWLTALENLRVNSCFYC
ncbi:MAG: hypothetical protein KME22_16765 [Hassallia sp. WJT32-NPBG1]|nr:hypothetical protein [Hassallia sp. WJT32-NPBG1]